MSIRKRGGSTYQADFMIKGTRYRSTFDTEAAAEDWEIDTRRALKQGSPLPAAKSARTSTGGKLYTLGQLYEHIKKTHWSQCKSGVQLSRNAREVVDILGHNICVSYVTRLDLQDVCIVLMQRGNSNATLNRKMAAIGKLLTEAVDSGVILKKPKVPRYKENVGRTRYLTPSEERQILKLFAWWGAWDIVYFSTFMLDTGLRVQEGIDLRWTDIEGIGRPEERGFIHIWESKGDLSRTLPLTTRAKEALGSMQSVQKRRDQPGPFSHFKRDGQLRTLWLRMRAELGFDDVVIHTMRHTCASRLAMELPIQHVQRWLGHKHIQTTMRYAHLSTKSLESCRDTLDEVGATVRMPSDVPKLRQIV